MNSADVLAIISAAAGTVWFGIIVLLHPMKPDLDPRTRMVSEYALGAHGWMMRLAFFCMAASCCALAAAGWARMPPLAPVLLVLCGISLAGAGVFDTDPVLPLPTEKAQTRSGALHILSAFGIFLIFPIAATVFSATLDAGPGARIELFVFAALMWIGLFAFFGAAAFRSAGRNGMPLGYFERFLLAAYTAWPVAAAIALLQGHQGPGR